jgi:hypothetical protein
MKMKRTLALLLSLALSVSLCACTVTPPEEQGGGSAVDSDTSSSSPTETSDPTPSTISFEQEFSSGNYTAGIDFPAGKYDIVAVSGGGNVSSSDGGINAVMGTEDKNELMDMYEQEYKNIDLPDGTTLTISGVTVRLTSDAASGDPLTPRNQEITETVDLGNGNFVAGEDFPAGVYNIVAVSGGGNVSSSNLYEGGINAILGTEDQNEIMDMYEQEYKNIDLPEGTTLTISGVQIQLVPSV